MRIQERSYSSKIFRPKPYLHAEADGSLLVVATSWGQPEHANLVADEIAKYVTAAKGDVEVTSPFEFLTCLSDQANHLRIGMMIANDILYRGENKAEYVSGVEVLAIARSGEEIAWAQVGAPHLLLRREGRPLVPLATAFDHSFELSLKGGASAPLPSRLLGVEPTSNIVCGDLRAGDKDLLVLLASSMLPQSLWTAAGPLDLQAVTRHLVQEDPDLPFWLGLVDFG
ncbi:MAG: hypothetical protein KF789_11660 [Bdellovibrionaceae bacterium]|nr:hypothetical protein [Pseudobdellovibrionaceae bacterium]